MTILRYPKAIEFGEESGHNYLQSLGKALEVGGI